MEKRILTYRRYMDELLKQEHADWETIRKEHLVQVGFFQHERLIHLIVTVVFALLEVISLCTFLMIAQTAGEGGLFLLLLVIAFLVLLVPYIRHYYILENETQKMYVQYDMLTKRCKIADGYEAVVK